MFKVDSLEGFDAFRADSIENLLLQVGEFCPLDPQLLRLELQGFLGFLSQSKIIEIIPTKDGDIERGLSIFKATHRLLRWYDESLDTSLKAYELTLDQRIKLHTFVIGPDGNLNGHSKNILRPALDFRLPKDFCFAAAVHDLAEVLYLEKGIHYDKPTGAKDQSGYSEESKYLEGILGGYGMQRDQIQNVLLTLEKSDQTQFGPMLKEIENLKFFEMRIYFEKLLEEDGALLRAKINEFAQGNQIYFSNVDVLFEAYKEYLQKVTQDIKSKAFHDVIQRKRDEFEKLLRKSCVDSTKSFVQA
jgi:hypothetical protein